MAPPFTGTFHLLPGGVEHLTLWFSSLSCLSKDGHHQLSFTKRPGEQPWQLVSHCCVCPQRRQSSVHSDQMPWEHLLKMMSPSLDFPTCHCISPIISHFNASDGGSQNSKHIQLYFWVCQLQRVFYQHPHLTGELQRQGLHKLWCNWSWPHQLLQTPFSIVSRAWEGMDGSRGPSSSEHTATSIGRPGSTQAPGRIESSLWKAQSLNSAKPSGEASTNTQVATFLWGTNFGAHLQSLHSADSDARGNQCSDAEGNTPPCLLYPQRQCLFRDHKQMRLSPLLASWAVFTTWATTPGTQPMNKLTHYGIYIKLNIIQP